MPLSEVCGQKGQRSKVTRAYCILESTMHSYGQGIQRLLTMGFNSVTVGVSQCSCHTASALDVLRIPFRKVPNRPDPETKGRNRDVPGREKQTSSSIDSRTQQSSTADDADDDVGIGAPVPRGDAPPPPPRYRHGQPSCDRRRLCIDLTTARKPDRQM